MAKRINSEDLADRLHSAAVHLLRRLRREDDASGLTAPRMSVLSVLVFGGSRTLGELALAEQVRPPTMTRLVDQLVADGLVVRRQDRSDRRVVRVTATAAGRRILTAGRRRRVRALARQLGSLTAREREALWGAAEILHRIVRSTG